MVRLAQARSASARRTASSAREDAAGMKAFTLGWPVAAEVGFGGAAIGPFASVQRATGLVRAEIATGGDNLGLQGEIPRPGHLAQIRRFPGSHQCLEPALPGGAHDLYLKVAAAGAPPGMVCGLTGGCGTGVFAVQHRKLAPRKPKLPRRNPHVLDHPELVAPELAGLGWLGPAPWRRPLEPMGPAASPAILGLEVTAGHVKHGVGVEVAVPLPQVAEGDVLGMAQQPGAFVIERRRSLVEATNAQQHAQAPTVRAEAGAGGHLSTMGLASLGSGCQIDASK